MARHIMAVCVVCLLCADRMPCEQHYDDGVYTANVEYKTLNAKVFQRLDDIKEKSEQKSNAGQLKFYSTDDSSQSNQHTSTSTSKRQPEQQHQQQQHTAYLDSKQNNAQHRHKRHAGHTHGGEQSIEIMTPRPAITQDFLQRIFDEYGHGDGSLSINEFRSMLKQLGLHKLFEQRLANNTVDQHNNLTSSSSSTSTGSCLADASLIQHLQEQISNHKDHGSEQHHHHHHHNVAVSESSHKLVASNNDSDDDAATNCTQFSTEELRNASSSSQPQLPPCVLPVAELKPRNENSYLKNYTLNDEDLINICPVLLYQLASPLQRKREGCIDQAILVEIEERSHKNSQTTNKEDMVYVWIYAFISVFACGILGLVGVAIIPFMDSRYYKHIIQYLVSLAVGTMTGDALLHLLPHSLAGQSETGMIFKGLTCMGGIIFFYLTEHGLTMISEWRKRRAKKDSTKQSRAKVVRDPDSSITNSGAGDKLCKSKYSSYPYCYDEIAMDTKNDVWMHLPNNTAVNSEKVVVGSVAERKRNGRAEANANEVMAAQSLLSTSHNNYAPMTEITNHHGGGGHHHQHQHDDHQQQLQSNHSELVEHRSLTDGGGNIVLANASGNGANTAANVGNIAKENNKTSDTVTVILREHESSHHGHSHKHGHVHSPPESLSAVAWMIIMGDGLHNFTDGMAIGAAFAENIAGGFSTSLAVFCHELPHELGDFAILMKAGMSVKSAVYYNLLTGVLSFIGMIFGIVFGQSQAAAQWMFAAAAGLFIYIALVDMMPELSAAHKSLEQLVLQIFGMSSGVLIMLLIAIYENDLMDAFSSTSSSSSSLSPSATTLSSSSASSIGPASGH